MSSSAPSFRPLQPLPSPSRDYARRFNGETRCMEAVCLYCFLTIGKSSDEHKLARLEARHDCRQKRKARQHGASR